MDFAFVPGTTDYELALQRILQVRANTKLIDDAKVTTVHDFFKKLVDMAVVADNLIVGAHASDSSFAITLDSNTQLPPDSNGHDYEAIKAVDTSGGIKIPAAVKTANTDLHLKGCNIGAPQAKPFVVLLKHALGTPRHVTAPKLVHAVKADGDRGVLEHMDYAYEVVNASAFKTHDELIEAFKQGSLIGGKFKRGVEAAATPEDVPDANWKNWVQKTLDLNPAVMDEIPFGIRTRVDPAMGKLKLIDKKNGLCRSRYEDYTAYKRVSGPMPNDDAGKMAFLKEAILSDGRNVAGHPFPLYVRYGYPDVAAFMKGMTWLVLTDNTDPTLLKFMGSHYVYTLHIPVVKKGTDKLIYNYYPASGTATINFAEDNTTFVMFGVE